MRHTIAITALLLMLLPLGAQAQRIHAYLNAGFSMNQINGDELRGFKKPGLTAGVGALVRLDERGRWGMSIETDYAQHGSHSTANTSYYLYRLDLTADYVEVPLLLHYQDPHGGMLVGAGLCYGRLVRQPHGSIGYSPMFFMPDTTDLTFLGNDISLVADARFTIWRGLQLNLRWQHSVLPVKRDWAFYTFKGYEADADGNLRERWATKRNNCYNHSIALRLIWQF